MECIPDRRLQRAYFQDASLLEGHLRQVGMREFGDTVIPLCLKLAASPFGFEFQFDIMPDGSLGSTVGVSARFACPPGEEQLALV